MNQSRLNHTCQFHKKNLRDKKPYPHITPTLITGTSSQLEISIIMRLLIVDMQAQ